MFVVYIILLCFRIFFTVYCAAVDNVRYVLCYTRSQCERNEA